MRRFLLFPALLLVACGGSGSAERTPEAGPEAEVASPTPQPRPAEATEAVAGALTPERVNRRMELLDADREFAEATARAGIGGVMSHFTPDGQMILPDGPVGGIEGIRSLMAPLFADTSYSITWSPEFADVSEAGDLGYTIGDYTSRRVDDSGQEVVKRGYYLTVWRRQADGRWKVEADIGTGGP
ncbi:MAG: YybH family protein [Gemmatimonadota bacterium]